MKIRNFEQIKVGGINWVIYGKTDNDVMLIASKCVLVADMYQAIDEYHGIAKFEGSKAEKYLTTKLTKKICSSIDYRKIQGRVELPDADLIRLISSTGFILPPIQEGTFWVSGATLGVHDAENSNYMLQCDNSGDLHKVCGIEKGGVRPRMTLSRSGLTAEDNLKVDIAPCVIDKTTTSGALYAKKNLEKVYRKEKGGICYKLRYHIILPFSEEYDENDDFLILIKRRAESPSEICTLQGSFVETISITHGYAAVIVNADKNAGIDAIITNVRSNLTPVGKGREEKRRAKKMWGPGYLCDTAEIPPAAIEDFLKIGD